MKTSAKIFKALIVTLIIFLGLTTLTYATPPTITAPNAIIMDYETGNVLYQHNAHEVTYPASTTKALTAIIAIETLDLDEEITVDYDIYVPGSSMYLLKGESFTVRELIQALLVRSANDVAELLAIRISGSVEEFAVLMNKRAKEMGALNTTFTNPHGLPDEDHLTTAYDLAAIARYAMENEFFRETILIDFLTFDETEQTPEKRYFRNTNRFLWATGGGNQIIYNGKYIDIKYDIVDGVKTGYTRDAQQTIITSAVKDGRRLIVVVLGAQSTNVYLDARTLIDYGFDNFQEVQLVGANNFQQEILVDNALVENLSLYTNKDLSAILPKDFDINSITKEVIINDGIIAPLEAGTTLGKLVYRAGDQILGEVDLIVNEAIEAKPIFIRSKRFLHIIIGVILFIILWQIFINYLRYRKKRRQFISYSGRSSYHFSKSLMKKR
ncbi:D-alanyl-D-alanine carboxypeptidase family protein [Alkaliphilus serpentinus]|uniref:serine-type D-Ala-D-Ala carboxypeptidase n=1 Tax=Alkaliphilus serpentinus TaxID=1482731 RepID=A0A833M9B1_9FIRM|nr:D-alanyl-D-alanine carboxypeptidase family protein [Alkaliphilus serpentinus]KAB3533110.1 D-alanyl-D-alanine carboxypeptidase [Alkaliphilus serpentinus]